MTLKKILLVISCLVIMLISACSSSSEIPKIDMDEGRWEITTKMEMANLPFSMPPMTYTMCLTKEDLIPQQDSQNQSDNCKVTTKSINGDTVSWTVVCDSGEGKTSSSGTITYNGNSFDGKIDMELPGAGPVSQSMTGRRVGDCK